MLRPDFPVMVKKSLIFFADFLFPVVKAQLAHMIFADIGTHMLKKAARHTEEYTQNDKKYHHQ